MKKILWLIFGVLAFSATAQVNQLTDIVRANAPSAAKSANAMEVMEPLDATGTNVYAVTASATLGLYSGSATYTTGDQFTINFVNSNTLGACSLNINSEGAISIKEADGSDPSVGSLSKYVKLVYTGSVFQRIGGTGASTYDGVSPTTVTVGGLPAGSDIDGDELKDIIEAIVAPYVAPVFTAFSVTGQSTTVEPGITLSGSKTFTWSITQNSGTVNLIDIYNVTTSANLVTNTPNDGSQAATITTVQLNSNGATQVWRAVGHDATTVTDFNSSSFTVTARFYRFYGPASATPANSAQVRALPSSAFHTGATTFTLNTGTTETKFEVALPPSVTISSVVDLDALNAVITSQYVLLGTINVLDAGGTNRSYNLYEMTIGVPYSVNHRHSITTSN